MLSDAIIAKARSAVVEDIVEGFAQQLSPTISPDDGPPVIIQLAGSDVPA